MTKDAEKNIYSIFSQKPNVVHCDELYIGDMLYQQDIIPSERERGVLDKKKHCK